LALRSFGRILLARYEIKTRSRDQDGIRTAGVALASQVRNSVRIELSRPSAGLVRRWTAASHTLPPLRQDQAVRHPQACHEADDLAGCKAKSEHARHALSGSGGDPLDEP